MKIENRFNLIDEPWIPIVDVGRVSLKQVFSEQTYKALGGNPVQKIALTKLLLAIAQAAYTPKDDEDWKNLSAEGMAQKCLEYLEKWHDRFWLYGERPFLQMPSIVALIEKRKTQELKEAKTKGKKAEAEEKALPKPIGSGLYPDLPADNNTILTETQFDHVLSDAEKAIFIISLMNLALGGKRIEKDLNSFTPNYQGKSDSAKAAPSIGNYVGYLHSYLIGQNLPTTLWFNLLTKEKIEENKTWLTGLGMPPWEQMPEGEDCDIAKRLKKSYMGCLVAMSRFVYLDKAGIYYVEGIQYPSHKEGWREPSIAIDEQNKKVKLLWVDPEKKPWRELTSLLSFINSSIQQGYDCQQIRFGLQRYRSMATADTVFGVWSGGLKVTSNSGDQSIKQSDDFVESVVMLPSNPCDDWFPQLVHEMKELEQLSNKVYNATKQYFEKQNSKREGVQLASQASNLYWQLCERKFQDLVDACVDFKKNHAMRKIFVGYANKAYNSFCPKETARQLDAWAECRPNFGKYLKEVG